MRVISRLASGTFLCGLLAACGCTTAHVPVVTEGEALRVVAEAPSDVARGFAAVVPSTAMGGRMGARVGYVLPVAEDLDDYAGSVEVGAYYAGVLKRLPYEIGFDAAWIETDAGGDKAGLYTLRFDTFFAGTGAYSGPMYYFLGGLGASLATPDVGDSELAGSVNLGFGIAMSDNRFDMRASYSVMLGSDNINGLVIAGVGMHF
jgi:hypothetical protein